MNSADHSLNDFDVNPVDLRAAEFVERRDSVDWTEADEAGFKVWLEEAPAHRVAFMRLNASWKRTERLIALRTPKFERPTSGVQPQKKRLVKAAIFCALIASAVGGFASYFSAPNFDTYATTVGGRETLSLHDGSKIELNTDTLVHISQTPQRRLVRLERGEAYFQVHHDEARPFVVVADVGRIIDLGTKFSVQSEQGQLKVSLVEGSVRFESSNQGQKVAVLSAGDVLVASANSISVTRAPMQELATALAWRKGMLVFHGTTLAEATREFNRYNETKIVIHDPGALHETISGALPANDLAEFERMARNIFGLQPHKQGNEIIFSR